MTPSRIGYLCSHGGLSCLLKAFGSRTIPQMLLHISPLGWLVAELARDIHKFMLLRTSLLMKWQRSWKKLSPAKVAVY